MGLCHLGPSHIRVERTFLEEEEEVRSRIGSGYVCLTWLDCTLSATTKLFGEAE
jgi:hypothetical protein